MTDWSADIGNDPDRDYELVIEIREGNEHRGRLERTETGELVFCVYPSGSGFRVPARWLSKLLSSAENELPKTQNGTE